MLNTNYHKLTKMGRGCSRRLGTSVFDILKKGELKNVLQEVVYF